MSLPRVGEHVARVSEVLTVGFSANIPDLVICLSVGFSDLESQIADPSEMVTFPVLSVEGLPYLARSLFAPTAAN